MEKKFFALIFLFASLIYSIKTDPTPTSVYANKITLVDGAYYLFWNYTNEDILFEIHAKTTGWIGFGLSPNGGMSGSDVIVTWIGENGKVYFTDRHIDQKKAVIVDKEQNWFSLYSANKDGFFVSKFTRKIKLCDSSNEDINIETGTPFCIFAWGTTAPSAGGDISYHGATNRGSKAIPLISSLNQNVRINMDEIETVEYRVNATIMNDVDTEYYCQMFKIPSEWATQKRHLVRYETLFTPGKEEYLHHWVLYECSNKYETEFLKNNTEVPPGECFSKIETDLLKRWKNVRQYCNKISLVWAVGGAVVQDFPTDFAYPLGGNLFKYFILEIHYDNPTLKKDVTDKSGMKLYVTKNYKKTEFGIFTVGAVPEWFSQLIPPQAEQFKMDYFCRKNCLNYLTDQPKEKTINVFSTMPHTHTKGKQLFTSIIRNGTEIGYIANNKNYDFNYQYYNFLNNPVTLQKDDELKTTCVYSTPNTKKFVQGGHSTEEEMCLDFIWYYPRTEAVSSCYEIIDPKVWSVFLGELNKTGEIEIITSPALDLIAKNPNQNLIDKFYNFYSQDRVGMCDAGDEYSLNKPITYKAYQEPKCIVSATPNIYIKNGSNSIKKLSFSFILALFLFCFITI